MKLCGVMYSCDASLYFWKLNSLLFCSVFSVDILCMQCSFARFMSGSGFDTWILELRGAGLSSLNVDADLGKGM